MSVSFVIFLLFAGSSVISGANCLYSWFIYLKYCDNFYKFFNFIPLVPKGRLLTAKEGCGFTKVTTNRIVGGSDAKPGAWPWIAQIGYRSKLSDHKTIYSCGKALLKFFSFLSSRIVANIPFSNFFSLFF